MSEKSVSPMSPSPSISLSNLKLSELESNFNVNGCTEQDVNSECKLENCTNELTKFIKTVNVPITDNTVLMGNSYEGENSSEDEEENLDDYFLCREFAEPNFSGVDYSSLCFELDEQTSNDEGSDGSEPYFSAEEGSEESDALV